MSGCDKSRARRTDGSAAKNRCKGVGRPARAIEGGHELAAEALAQRMTRHERLDARNELALAAALELSVDMILLRHQSQLLEPANLGGGERLQRQLGEWFAAP